MAKFSVKKPLTVFVAVIAVIVLGVVAFTNMTPDLLPNMNLPYVVIVTPYPGATPEKVESMVTKPLEQSMSTLENIKNVTSTSSENSAVIILEFTEDVNMDTVTVDILQNISQIQPYWDDMVGSPYIMKLNPSMLPVMVAAVNIEGMSTRELSTFMDSTLMNKLEGIDGVASVSASGLIEEKIHVVLSQEKINAKNAQVEKAIDGEFADAIQELEDTKAELEAQLEEINGAIKELEAGIEELAGKTAEGDVKLNEAQMQMLEGKLQINQQIAMLMAQQAELETQKAQMVQLRDGIVGLEQVVQGLTALEGALPSIIAVEQGMAMPARIAAGYANDADWVALTPEERQAILMADETYAASINAVMDTPTDPTNPESPTLRTVLAGFGISFFDSVTITATVSTLKTEMQTQLDTLTIAMQAMGMSDVSQLDVAIGQIDAGKVKLQEGIAKLQEMLVKLEAGTLPLNEAMKELETVKTTTQFEMAALSTQLMLGENQLSQALAQVESGLEQVQEAKKQALKQANLNNMLTMDMVSQILVAQNFSMPVGYVQKDKVQTLVSVGEDIPNVEALQSLVLLDMGIGTLKPIYLRDVADIYVVDNADSIYARIDGEDGVLLTFSKQSNASTALASDNIQAKFEELSAEYDGLHFFSLMDQGDYIYLVVDSIMENLLLGAVFAVLILLLFLKDLRPTFITLCSIPVSVIFALALMYFSGVTLNIISLSGLAVAVGMLVDNSVVVIENIYRLRALGYSAVRAAVSGTAQVTGAIAASTLTTVCVFLPIVFVEGLTRDLFTDMALTLGYSLVASLIVALTLVPALSSKILTNAKPKESKWLDKALKVYAKSVRWTLRHRALVMLGTTGLLILSLVAVLMRGFTFMPDMSMPQLTVDVRFEEGTTFEEAKGITDEVLARIEPIEGIETTGAMMGGGSVLGGLMGGMGGGGSDDMPSSASIYIILDEKHATQGAQISAAIDEACAAMTTAEVSASASSGMSMSALTGSGISIQLFGDDLDDLQQAAKDVGAMLEGMENTREVSNGIGDTSPEIRFVVDKEKAMKEGLTTAQVYAELAKALTTEKTSTSLSFGAGQQDVIIIKGDEARLTPEYIKSYRLTLTNQDGEERQVHIRDIAKVVETETKNSIARDNQRRYITVTAQTAPGQNVSLVTAEVERNMREVQLPAGVTAEFTGENESIMEAMRELMNMLLLGVLLVYLIMVAQFQSLKSPFIVMFTIPLAFTGGLLALLITGMEMSVIALIGFVMLVGIIVNNGIVLVDYINQLRQGGMERDEAIVEAGVTRMRPILMTSITTILGLVVMAFGRGVGSELMQPIAVVSIGGLLYATLLTLYVVPVMYKTLNRKELTVIDEEDLLIVED